MADKVNGKPLEEIVRFGPDEGLIGILNTARDGALDGAAVLLLNAGVIHRSGPARLNQKIACGLATFGIPSLRFDFSGIGDSTLRCDTSLRQRFVSDTQGAMDYLQRRVSDVLSSWACVMAP